jgi:hypothetical protein
MAAAGLQAAGQGSGGRLAWRRGGSRVQQVPITCREKRGSGAAGRQAGMEGGTGRMSQARTGKAAAVAGGWDVQAPNCIPWRHACKNNFFQFPHLRMRKMCSFALAGVIAGRTASQGMAKDACMTRFLPTALGKNNQRHPNMQDPRCKPRGSAQKKRASSLGATQNRACRTSRGRSLTGVAFGHRLGREMVGNRHCGLGGLASSRSWTLVIW